MYFLRPIFRHAVYGASQVVLHCGLMSAFRCVGSEALWEGFPFRSRSAAAFDCSGLRGRSYKVIRKWLLPMLVLEASERDHAAS